MSDYFNPNNPNNYFAIQARDQANDASRDADKSRIAAIEARASASVNAIVAGQASKRASNLNAENIKLEAEKEFFKNLLSKPMAEIAAKNGEFKKTYDKQQNKLASWILSQKAYKETALKLGLQLGKLPVDVQVEYEKNIEYVLDNKTMFGNDSDSDPLLKEKTEEIKKNGMTM